MHCLTYAERRPGAPAASLPTPGTEWALQTLLCIHPEPIAALLVELSATAKPILWALLQAGDKEGNISGSPWLTQQVEPPAAVPAHHRKGTMTEISGAAVVVNSTAVAAPLSQWKHGPQKRRAQQRWWLAVSPPRQSPHSLTHARSIVTATPQCQPGVCHKRALSIRASQGMTRYLWSALQGMS
jgi:hypothetical protein